MNKLKRIGIKTKRGKRVFTSIKYPTIPLSEQDLYLTSTIGDRLDILAEEFYSDKELWWIAFRKLEKEFTFNDKVPEQTDGPAIGFGDFWIEGTPRTFYKQYYNGELYYSQKEL